MSTPGNSKKNLPNVQLSKPKRRQRRSKNKPSEQSGVDEDFTNLESIRQELMAVWEKEQRLKNPAGTVLPSGLEELLANIPSNKLPPPAESKSPKTPNATKNVDKNTPVSGKRCSNQGTPRTNRQQEQPAKDNSGPFFKNNRIYHPSKEVSQIVNDLGLNRVDDTIFPDYMSLEEVNAGLSNGTLIEGSIRINSKNFKDAYISSPVEMEVDILIDGVRDRNRALDGDVVVVRLRPFKIKGQKTGEVVYIKEQIHPRKITGYLKLMPDKSHQVAAFTPRDSKVPRIRIPFTDWPENFYHESEKYEKTVFLVMILQWTDTRYAYGSIIEKIGLAGDLKVESKAILLEWGLDGREYGPEMAEYYPKTGDIQEGEFLYREDLRKMCVFTIDPLTARDLDDAMSVRKLDNGNYEIGVHISDVSYYLKENTPLDEAVARKATTIYLTDSVYHMLPRELCLMCSLLPGTDRLAFSVFWEMTPDNRIANYRFKRTILNSCVQLAYEHVQEMLEQSKEQVKFDKFPKIFGDYTYDEIYGSVQILNKFASVLRKNRFDNGALKINQPKLAFQLNRETGLPEAYYMYIQKESHGLIEEFMLLANITVATTLKSEFPDIAFLRRHPPPQGHLMHVLKESMAEIGVHLDISSAGGLQQSMAQYGGSDLMSEARNVVLNALCSKPMSRAKYFCAGAIANVADYMHYALNVPLYTHFTSPIRRYADVMVHRLLAAKLGYTEKPNWVLDEVNGIAANCNKFKYNAKRAGEASAELYLTKYIEIHQPLQECAVVVDIKEKSFGIIILKMGLNLRIHKNKLQPAVLLDDNVKTAASMLTLMWPNSTDNRMPAVNQIISIFTVLNVELTCSKKTRVIEAKLLRPS